jgi:hypothetical protein
VTRSLLRSLIRETLLTEEVYGAQAVVYHGTNADPRKLISALLNDEFAPGKGAGAMYGKGLYTVYDLKGTQTERGDYGAHIIKLKLNLYGYIIFDPEVALKVYKAPLSVVEQAEEIGLDEDLVEMLKGVEIDRGNFTSDAALAASNFLKGHVKGLVFTGRNDGRVAVVYDSSTAVPISWKKIRSKSWTPVDRSSIRPALRRSASGDWQEEKYESSPFRVIEKLKKLPVDQRVVGGDLNLSDAPIASLPPGLQVGGTLNLSDTLITSLPDGLRVGGTLNLSNTPITSLPPGLRVGGSLGLHNTRITSLPDGLRVGGGLFLSNTRIKSLPPGLQVGGDLDLDDSLIESIPPDLQVGGTLNLSDTPIESLPAGLRVGGDINLASSRINFLPQGFQVGGNLDIRGTRIKSLPAGLRVGGGLFFSGTPITSLPSGLEVGGGFSLWGTNITSLPDGLKVGGYLDLSYAPIKSFPEDLQVDGSIRGFKGDLSLVPEHLRSKIK